MAERPFRFFPARGLDLTRIDDRSLQGNPMRGGVNIRVVDSEWWCREGEQVKRRQVAGCGAAHAISLDLDYAGTSVRRHFLIAHWGVLEIDVANAWQVSVPYSSNWTGTLNVTNGSAYAYLVSNSANIIVPGDILIAPDYDGLNTAYHVVSINPDGLTLGARLQLDRSYVGPTNATLGLNSYGAWGAYTTVDDSIHTVTWTVFRQRVSYLQGDIWSDGSVTTPWRMEKSPATQPVPPGGIYLVVAFGPEPLSAPAAPRGPIAIRLDQTFRCLFDFMRQTHLGNDSNIPRLGAGLGKFSSTSFPSFVTTYKDRLIVAREDDQAANSDRTIWYSQPGDLMLWHTGIAGAAPVATPNLIRFTDGDDRITGMLDLGDDLIVHRERSQQIIKANASGVAPFLPTRNHQGLGLVASKSLISVRGIHYLWTSYGPAVFDGQQIQLLDESLRRIATSHDSTEEWASSVTALRSSHAFYHATRQQIWWKLQVAGDINTPGGSFLINTPGYMIYDLPSGNAWKQGYPSQVFGGGIFRLSALPGAPHNMGIEVVVRSTPDGSLFQSTQTQVARDDNITQGVHPDEPFAYCETPWTEMGSPRQKNLERLEFEFRLYDPTGIGGEDTIYDVDIQAAILLNVYVFTDEDIVPVPIQYELQVPRADLQAVVGYAEGSRLPPKVTAQLKVRKMGTTFKLQVTNLFTVNTRTYRLSQLTAWVIDELTTREERTP